LLSRIDLHGESIDLVREIEVFVKSQEVLSPIEVDVEHSCYHGTAREIGCKVERRLPKFDKHVLNTVRVVAEEKGLKVKVYNISTLSGRLRARLKGVQKTPTIFVNNKRICEKVSKRRLLDALK